MDERVTINTDGSSLGNPGPGGYGIVIRMGELKTELSEGYKFTTNNRMEMMAVIKALESLSGRQHVDLYTDSQYAINGATKWVRGWRINNWKTREGFDVKNKDLWIAMSELLKTHKVKFHKVLGHSGVEDNERCDVLAKEAAAKPTLIDEGYVTK